MITAHAATLPVVRPFRIGKKTRAACLLSTLVGVLTFLCAMRAGGAIEERMWYNYLLNYFYWSCLGLAGVFFIALQYITGSVWSVTLRRVAEGMAAFLPVALLFFFGIIAGEHHLYEWTHGGAVAAHPVLREKLAYLNTPFFTLRNIFFLLLWIGLGGLMVRNSIQQDATGDAQCTTRNTKLAGAFLLSFAITFTLASFDLIMSLSPEWYSTIFGVYCFAGLFVSGIAMITLLTTTFYRQGRFGPYLRPDHLFDLGKLMLAFTVFWAYIAFSQYMLIWYADLPEETNYMLLRMTGAWTPISWALLVVNFIIPFLLLLPQALKRSPLYLRCLALWILAAHYLDCYWLIVPQFAHERPVFGWIEIGMFAGFAGLFGLVLIAFFSRVPLVPRGDPRLHEAMEFHQ